MVDEFLNNVFTNSEPISVSLIKAKRIFNKIDNYEIKYWLACELDGYKNDELPEYRYVHASTHITFRIAGREVTKIISANDHVYLNEHRRLLNTIPVVDSIHNLELNFKASLKYTNHLVVVEPIPEREYATFRQILNKPSQDIPVTFMSGYRKYSYGSFESVFSKVKIKLINYIIDMEDKIQNLAPQETVNTDAARQGPQFNLEGHFNGPIILTSGNNNQSTLNQNIGGNVDFGKLAELGVEEKDITELQTILLNETHEDKASLGSKLMKWIQPVTTSLIARKLYDSIPEIQGMLHTLML